MTYALHAAEIAAGARKLIARPGAWTKGRDAETDDGHSVAADHPRAVRWCGSGAIQKVSRETTGHVNNDILLGLQYAFVLANPGPWTSIQAFNDRHETKLDHVLAAFDRTEKYLREDPLLTRGVLEDRLTHRGPAEYVADIVPAKPVVPPQPQVPAFYVAMLNQALKSPAPVAKAAKKVLEPAF